MHVFLSYCTVIFGRLLFGGMAKNVHKASYARFGEIKSLPKALDYIAPKNRA